MATLEADDENMYAIRMSFGRFPRPKTMHTTFNSEPPAIRAEGLVRQIRRG